MPPMLTVEAMRRRERDAFRPAGRPASTVLDPATSECAPLFTSARFNDCLTHLTRWIIFHPEWSFESGGRRWHRDPYEWATGWCGVLMSARQISLADASGFACAHCIDRATEFGRPTFGLIPDTGCAVSGGKRGRRSR